MASESPLETPTYPGLVSVIIPVRNAQDTISEQLEAMAGQTYAGKWELIISDNGSTDATLQVVDTFRGKVPHLIVTHSNQPGVNVARNAGVRAAKGDYLLFCDADDVAAPLWVEAMAKRAQHCDLQGGFLEMAALNDPEVLKWRRTKSFGADLTGFFGFLPSPAGANCGFRADICHRIGYWNERYARGGDDLEFFWRAQLAGYRLCYTPEAIMHYRYRDNMRSWIQQAFHYGRTQAQLYEGFRKEGMPRSSTVSLAKEIAWLIYHLPDLRAQVGRAKWFGKVASRVGRLAGSAQNLVWFP